MKPRDYRLIDKYIQPECTVIYLCLKKNFRFWYILTIQDIVKALVEMGGANVNSTCLKTGRTALHNACASGCLGLVAYLSRCEKIDLNATTYDDYMPFDVARFNERQEVMVFLNDLGKEVERRLRVFASGLLVV